MTRQSRHCVIATASLLAPLALGLPGVSHAIDVAGPITANAVWTTSASPYRVTADITIDNGATLDIQPGVTVTFEPGTNLTVTAGALRALGTAAAPIVFTASGAATAPGSWGALRFQNGTNDAATVLQYVQVRYGEGIVIEAAAPTLNRLTITDNAGPAIRLDLASSPTGIGLQASGNGVNGIVVPAGDIAGSSRWGLTGIPYIVEQGVVSVGQSPVLQAATPNRISQGETLDMVLTGSRLSGAESVSFNRAGLSATVQPGATVTAIPIRVTAAGDASLGLVTVTAQVAAGRVTLVDGLTVAPPKPPISVTGIAPDSIRRTEVRLMQVSGENLEGASVSTSALGLAISNVQSTPTQLTFTLFASASATLGAQTFTVTNPSVASGSATVQVTVLKEAVKVSTTPAPISVPPDSVARQIRVRLSEPDTVTHDFTVSLADATLATLSPAAFSIPAGETEASFGLTGVRAGETTLTISSPLLATVQVPVVVTSEYINSAYTPTLGVYIESSTPSQHNLTSETPLLGVVIEGSAQNQSAIETPLLGVVVGTSGAPAVSSNLDTPLLGVVVGADAPAPSQSTLDTPVLGVTLGNTDSAPSFTQYTPVFGVFVGDFVQFGQPVATFWSTDKTADSPIGFADVNGDGRQDFYGWSSDGNVYVRLATGDGGFGEPSATYWSNWKDGDSPIGFADITGDGRADLYGWSNAGQIYVDVSNGDGTFGPRVVGTYWSTAKSADGPIGLADINGDGRQDFWGWSQDGNVHVRFSNGDGTFGTSSLLSWSTSKSADGPIGFSDINGDGRADFYGWAANGNIVVRLSNGDGTFGSPINTFYGTEKVNDSPWGFADINGDGRQDFWGWTSSDGNIHVRLSQGNGGFGPSVTTFWSTSKSSDSPVGFADINGDGKRDFYGWAGNGNIHVRLSRGDGTFSPSILTFWSTSKSGDGPIGFTDVSGDGKEDLYGWLSNGNVTVRITGRTSN